jgi:putative transposase
MPSRGSVFAKNEVYHVFNRSIARENIFSLKSNLKKALEIVEFYRLPQQIRLSKFKSLTSSQKNEYVIATKDNLPLVEIYAFAFMPNHFHLLLKQLQDGGIVRFTANFQNSFAKVFNLKNSRDGALFQNSFKSVRIETDEQLLHVSRYIHLNPVTGYLIDFKELANYPWTSFPKYVNEERGSFVNVDLLLNLFASKEKLVAFVSDQVAYQRELALIKDLMLE